VPPAAGALTGAISWTLITCYYGIPSSSYAHRLAPLEESIAVPVDSSTPHGLWHCARMLGVPARIEGFGIVMAA
jgi:hypothetical protein